MDRSWTPEQWRDLPAEQQPEWPDPHVLEQTLKSLSALPPLVFAGEARSLQRAWPRSRRARPSCSRPATAPSPSRLHRRQHPGQAQGHPADGRRAHLRRRRAGGQAGPHRRPVRQAPLVATTEVVDGVELPSFRGHIVNDDAPTLEARTPDPTRMLTAYHQSASTLNLLRAFTKGGFADLSQVHMWNQQFVAGSPRASATRRSPARSTGPCASCGPAASTSEGEASLHQVDFYTSHEALILGYEEALTRGTRSPATGTTPRPTWCGSASAPASWTAPTSTSCPAVNNPVAAKIGPTPPPTRWSPCAPRSTRTGAGSPDAHHPLGAGRVAGLLPGLLRGGARRRPPGGVGVRPDARQHLHRPRGAARPATSTTCSPRSGVLRGACRRGHLAGGVHVELTGDNVTECLGGAEEDARGPARAALHHHVRPPAQRRQSLDLAFQVAELLRAGAWRL
jgi:3-deoxy-7-phosphoheptulonate synthase